MPLTPKPRDTALVSGGVCAVIVGALFALVGCGGSSSETPAAPTVPVAARTWSAVALGSVNATSMPEVFSDGVGGALVVSSSPTATVVQRFDGATSAWAVPQTFDLATEALRSATGVTLVGHDNASWWRIGLSAKQAATPVAFLARSESNSEMFAISADGKLLLADYSGSDIGVREFDGSSLAKTTTYGPGDIGALLPTAFVRDADGDWLYGGVVGFRVVGTQLGIRLSAASEFSRRLIETNSCNPILCPPAFSISSPRIEGDGRASVTVSSTASPTVASWQRLGSGALKNIWSSTQPGRVDGTSRIVRADGTPVWLAYDANSASNRIWEGTAFSPWITVDPTEAGCFPERLNCLALSSPSATRLASLSQNPGQATTSNELIITERGPDGRWVTTSRLPLTTPNTEAGAVPSTGLVAYLESGAFQIVVGFASAKPASGNVQYVAFATSK